MIDLDTIEAAARAQLVTWSSVQLVQTRAMPRCHNHPDRAAWAISDARPLCADCVAALIKERKNKYDTR